MEDPEIVELFWQRDEAAIREAGVKYRAYCAAIAGRLLNNPEDVEECVSDALLGAWNAIPPHRPKVLSAFLGKITRRLALKRAREDSAQKRGGGSARESYEELADCLSGGPDPEEALEAAELSRLINAFLAGLNPEERRFFVCRYWYFDSIEEISARFGCGQSKVKMSLKRTRDKLAAFLRREGITL